MTGSEVTRQTLSKALWSSCDTNCTLVRLLCTFRSNIHLLNSMEPLCHFSFQDFGFLNKSYLSFHYFWSFFFLLTMPLLLADFREPCFLLQTTQEKKWKHLVNPKPSQHKLVSAKAGKNHNILEMKCKRKKGLSVCSCLLMCIRDSLQPLIAGAGG